MKKYSIHITKETIILLIILSMAQMSTHAAVSDIKSFLDSDNFPCDTLKKELCDTLEEVIVKSEYKYVRRKGDKYIISFRGSSFFQDKTLDEGLTICPLLTRRGDNINIVGKETTIIYINGRPTAFGKAGVV